LDREEWIAVVTQMFLRKHVESGGMGVAEAVQAFFIDDIAHNVPSMCLQDSNRFRAEYCYIEATDMVLRKYENSLRNLYEAFAKGDGAIGHAVFTTKLMDFGEYMEMVNRFELIDPFVTQREIRLAFVWCRMVVEDEKWIKGRQKVVQLHFEDFLELIVRLAHMTALPTEDELADACMAHAGEFLDALEAQPEAEQDFKRLHTCEPGEPVDQPIAWKVQQFVLWTIYRARGGQGNPESELTVKEANRFMEGRIHRVRVIDQEPGAERAATAVVEDEYELRRDGRTAPGEAPPPVGGLG